MCRYEWLPAKNSKSVTQPNRWYRYLHTSDTSINNFYSNRKIHTFLFKGMLGNRIYRNPRWRQRLPSCASYCGRMGWAVRKPWHERSWHGWSSDCTRADSRNAIQSSSVFVIRWCACSGQCDDFSYFQLYIETRLHCQRFYLCLWRSNCN